MLKRVVNINIKYFNNEIKEMSYVEIGKYIHFLINVDTKNIIKKDVIENLYQGYLPKYISRNIRRVDIDKYEIINVKSILKKEKKCVSLLVNPGNHTKKKQEKKNVNILDAMY